MSSRPHPRRVVPPFTFLVSVALVGAAASAQTPGVVNTNPPLPPTAGWPQFVDVSATKGSAGTTFNDQGAGRGVAWVDIVGRDPSDPTDPDKVGPPDGILDFVQVNSNSPALPLGSTMSTWTTPPVGSRWDPVVVFRGEADGQYTNVTQYMGVTPEGFDIAYPGGSPWGVLPADYDLDGDLDLFFPCGGFNMASPNALLRNDGGVFVNVSDQAGIGGTQVSFGGSWFDYDRDGDLDLYVANSVGFPGLYFLGVTGSNDPTDRLYRNNGDGTFTDVAAQAGVALKSTSFSVAASDLDNDGWIDLVVSCFAQYNKTFYNNGDGTFSFVVPKEHKYTNLNLSQIMVPDPAIPNAEEYAYVPYEAIVKQLPIGGHPTMMCDVADMNGDGWMDIVFGSFSFQLPDANALGAEGALYSPAERGYLYLNLGDQDGDGKGDGNFREVGDEVGFEPISGTMGMHVADFDGNAYPDIYLGNGGPNLSHQLEEDLYYANEGSAWPANFQDDPSQPLGKAMWELGALAGSYTNILMAHGLISTVDLKTGRVELLVANGGPGYYNAGQENLYYANTGRGDGEPIRTMAIDLDAQLSPPTGTGTRVTLLRADDGGVVRKGAVDRRIGVGFGCSTYGPLVLGLDDETPIYASAAWTSGVRQGRYLLDSTARSASLAEPLASMDVRRKGDSIVVTLENRDTTPLAADLVLKKIGHVSAGFSSTPGQRKRSGTLAQLVGRTSHPDWFTTLGEVVESGLTLAPGAAWSRTFAVDPHDPPALHRFELVDAVSHLTLNEDAAWMNGEASSAGAPASGNTTPWTSTMRASGDTPSAARPIVYFRNGITIDSDRVEITAYPAGKPVRLVPRSRMTLGVGDLAINRNRAVVRLTKETIGTVSFSDDTVVVTLGAGLTCCDETVESKDIHLVEFSNVNGSVQIDGLEYTPEGARTTP